MTTTADQPTRTALLPDWREGVTLTQVFDTTVQRSRAGLEQRNRRRQAPLYWLDYVRTGLTPAEARGRLEAIRAEFRGPLTVPVWTDGIQMQNAMSGATAAVLDASPIAAEWPAPFDVYLWHAEMGGEWRRCLTAAGRNLTFEGLGTVFPAGTYVFPSRRMMREIAEGMLSAVDVESGTEHHRYRTI